MHQEFGRTDILVNNAGRMLLEPFIAEQRAEHRQMVEVNLLGAMTTTEVFLDQLRDGGGLVNISSVAGGTARTACAGSAVYAATKTGLGGWSEVLRQELQPGVRVMVIELGAVATELPDHITHAQTRPEIDQFYQQLAILAQEIAAIISFCVSRPRTVSINEILVRPTAQAL